MNTMSQLGITAIGSYIPDTFTSNLSKKNHHVTKNFIESTVGIYRTAKKRDHEKVSDLCVYSFHKLLKNHPELEKDKIECICVCTQTGDFKFPHTSAVVHNKLNLNEACSVFDISLGCTGYIQSLHIFKDFMQAQNLGYGLLFTGETYSEIIDNDDKNTDLISIVRLARDRFRPSLV